MSLKQFFTEHPASVDETYGQHFGHAFGFGWRMVLAGLACMIHGLLPNMFVCTGSTAISHLHERMVNNRRRPQAASARTTAH